MKYSAFISYASEDQKKVLEIVERLEAAGLVCWVAPRDVRPGREYPKEIIRGIEESESLVLILSSSSNKSRFVPNEVESAYRKGKLIFPFRIEEVMPSPELELLISKTHWIDAWSGSLITHVNQLAKGLLDSSDDDNDSVERKRFTAAPSTSSQSKVLRWTALGGVAVAAIVAAAVYTNVGNFFRDSATNNESGQVVNESTGTHTGDTTTTTGDTATTTADTATTDSDYSQPDPAPPPFNKQQVEVIVKVEPTRPEPVVDPLAIARDACTKALDTVSTDTILDLRSVSKPTALSKLLDRQLEALSESEAKFVTSECKNPEVVKQISPEQRTALGIAQLRIGKKGMAEKTLAPAAGAGESWANFILGLRQFSRINQSRDESYRGEDHLARASDAGNISAKLALGLLYVSRGGEYGDKVNKGLGLLGQVARQDYAFANFLVGYYQSGLVRTFEDRKNLASARQKFTAAESLGFSLSPDAKLVLDPPSVTPIKTPANPVAVARKPETIVRRPEPVVPKPRPDTERTIGTRVAGRMQVAEIRPAQIFEQPSRQSRSVKTLAPGTVVTIRERLQGGLWYLVELDPNTVGYAFKPDLESMPGERVTVTDTSANFPSAGSKAESTYGAVDSEKLQALLPNREPATRKSGGVLIVEGAVRNPGSHALKSATTVKNALRIAGGLAPNANTGAIELVRGRDKKRLKARPSTIVRPGDRLIVQKK